MPFDGNPSEWEKEPRKQHYWYVVIPLGQKNKRKIWRVDILTPGLTENNWWPLASFYASNTTDARFYGGYIIRNLEI